MIIIAFTLLLGKGSRHLHFAPTPLASVGFFVQAVGFGIAAWTLLSYTTLALRTATGILGILSALCAAVAGIYAIRGYRTHPLFFCPGSLFFVCFLFCRYQQWSAEPQLQNYAFQLLASIFLMMTSFYRASLELSGGKLRGYVFCNQTSLFFCCLSLTTSLWPFYLATGIWTVTDLISLRAVRPAKPKNPQPEEN